MQHSREPAFAVQIIEALHWTLPNSQGAFPSGVRIGSAPSLVNPSCLLCIKFEKVPPVQEFEREEIPPSPMVVDGEEEYAVEVTLLHKSKGA